MLETTPSRVDEMPAPREPDEVPQAPDEIRPQEPTEEGLPDEEQDPGRTKDEQQRALARCLRVRANCLVMPSLRGTMYPGGRRWTVWGS